MGRYYHSTTVFNNDLWVIAGEDVSAGVLGDVWDSADGVNWTETNSSAPFGAREDQTSLTFNDGTATKMWVIGGQNGTNFYGDVWSSTDGGNWTETATAAFSGRGGHSSVVFNGKMWVIAGGYSYGAGGLADSDVWNSPDGVNWTQVTANAAFGQRSGQESVVFNNKIWVIGGASAGGGTWYNDVWSSPDGVTWTEATAAAGFSGRLSFGCQVYNGLIWVYSGVNNTDVWSSPDGVNWTEASANGGFSGRIGPSSAVFNNEIWLIAGEHDAPGFVYPCPTDAWYSP